MELAEEISGKQAAFNLKCGTPAEIITGGSYLGEKKQSGNKASEERVSKEQPFSLILSYVNTVKYSSKRYGNW